MDNIKWIYNYWNCAWVRVKGGDKEEQLFKVNDLCFTYKQIKQHRTECLNQIACNLEVTLHPDNIPVPNDYMQLHRSMNDFVRDMDIEYTFKGQCIRMYKDVIGDAIAMKQSEKKLIKKSHEEVQLELKTDKD